LTRPHKKRGRGGGWKNGGPPKEDNQREAYCRKEAEPITHGGDYPEKLGGGFRKIGEEIRLEKLTPHL